MTINEQDTWATITIKGSLDVTSSLDLDNQFDRLLNSNIKKISIDCTDMDYITSPGIGVFTSRLSELEQKGVKLVLYGVSEKVYSVFKVLGLDMLIELRKKED